MSLVGLIMKLENCFIKLDCLWPWGFQSILFHWWRPWLSLKSLFSIIFLSVYQIYDNYFWNFFHLFLTLFDVMSKRIQTIYYCIEGQQCVFNGTRYGIGTKLYMRLGRDNLCDECQCSAPPHFTCVSTACSERISEKIILLKDADQ